MDNDSSVSRSRLTNGEVREIERERDRYRGVLEAIDREARVVVLNDEDAQARHQRMADLARGALDG